MSRDVFRPFGATLARQCAELGLPTPEPADRDSLVGYVRALVGHAESSGQSFVIPSDGDDGGRLFVPGSSDRLPRRRCEIHRPVVGGAYRVETFVV